MNSCGRYGRTVLSKRRTLRSTSQLFEKHLGKLTKDNNILRRYLSAVTGSLPKLLFWSGTPKSPISRRKHLQLRAVVIPALHKQSEGACLDSSSGKPLVSL